MLFTRVCENLIIYVTLVFSVKALQSELNSTTAQDGELKPIHPGKELFLTPYIEQGRSGEGRRKALVKPFVKNVKSYAGYLTVNKQYNSNIFFWYFESENAPKSDPTVVWLQGGPGSSSLFGLFMEHGPYIIKKNKILKRKHSWSKVSNIIYIDNPVGTGYSFTEDDSGYAKEQTQVGEDLYAALVQILKLFPTMRKNDVFITGESYAGKYVPALGRTIHLRNQDNPEVFVKLKGLMIGNGFTDPRHMMLYSKYLYANGLIDDHAKRKLHLKESRLVKSIRHNDWHKATELFNKIINGDNSLYFKYTGLTSYFNYYNPKSGYWYDFDQKFVTSNLFRSRVHVGARNYSDGTIVYEKLYNDMTKSVIGWVASLLNHYRIVFYNGQLDVICAYPLTVSYLRSMNWPLKHAYKTAKRHRYLVNGEVAGYYKSIGNLTEVLVRNAGHMVPTDQPSWSLQLLKDFMHDTIQPKKNNTVVE